ncbi:uncharacterized protein LOC129733300 [Wyeomyia smithii]|uniref:uncharacterized protein LOC129733300 n=1 Tax=Wyeomyia smithii TaxID=174621 RepID=UPI002468209C|nr:uncharacterized protein LOC129733300 [Wyeomyia smithii]
MRLFVVPCLFHLSAMAFAGPIVTKAEYEELEVPSPSVTSYPQVPTTQYEASTQVNKPAYFNYYSTPSYSKLDVSSTTSYPTTSTSTTDKYWNSMLDEHNKKYHYITETLGNYNDKMADQVRGAFAEVHQAMSYQPKKYAYDDIYTSSSSGVAESQKNSAHLKLALGQLEEQLAQMKMWLAIKEASQQGKSETEETVQRRPGGY